MSPKPPAALVRYIRESRCVLFVGSGLSSWAGLPTWHDLLTRMLDQVGDEDAENRELSEVRQLLNSAKLLDVADFCLDALGHHRFYSSLRENLRGSEGAIPEPHRILVRLPFAGIVTTNYDKLLERSFAHSSPKTPTHADIAALGPLLFDGAFFILKAHGDIDRPDTIVLTASDYQRLIHRNAAFQDIFSAILLTKAILFIGYSLNDPDFRLLLDRHLTVFDRHVPDRYALMAGVGKIERELLWRTAGIRVIPYDKGEHRHVVDFLNSLATQMDVEPGLPPRAQADMPSPFPIPHRTQTVLTIACKGQALEISLELRGSIIQSSASAPDFAKLADFVRTARSADEIRNFAELLSGHLPKIILDRLADIESGQLVALRISPDLDVLPWEWTLVDGEFLVERNILVRAPGVSDATRGYPSIRHPGKVLVVGDPNSGDGMPLPGALKEAQAIGALYRGNPGITIDSLLGSQATFDVVAEACRSGRYDIIHFAGHAWFDDEPFIFLSHKVRLHASELRSLLSAQPPAVLFLNSHYSFFMPPGAFQNEGDTAVSNVSRSAMLGHRGFLDAASRAGVGALIGTFSGWLNDDVAEFVGTTFHRNMLNGEPVALALHNVTRSINPHDNSTDRLFYALSGYGDLKYDGALQGAK
jgi:hypothetical protein